jgi:hypothetical protein
MAIGTAAAMLGSAAIGAAGSIIGGNKAADAQKSAAKLQARQAEENRKLLLPAIQSGDRSRGVLEEAIGLQGRDKQQAFYDNFETDPGFQGSVDYGIQNIDARVGALGSRRSGNTLAALSDFGQRSMYDAYQNRLNRLQALASGGQATAGQLAGINTQSAANQASNVANAGYYQGAGIQNAANSIGGGLQNYGVLKAYQSPTAALF